MNALSAHIRTTEDSRFENEAGLLGAILMYADPVLFRAAAAVCGPEHFYDPFNARLFETIGAGIDSGLSAFRLVHWVMGAIRDDKTLREAGVSASELVGRYCSRAFPAIAVEGAARQVKHDFLKIELACAAEIGNTATAEEVAAEMERLSRAHTTPDGGLQHISGAASSVLDALSNAFAAGGAVKDFAHPGSAELARTLGGWRRGRFYVVAGRPGMGKTTTGLSWLLRSAARGHGVLFFSLEMGRDELTEIALCDIAYDRRQRIEYRDISTTAVGKPGFEDRFAAISAAHQKLANIPFAISDKAGQTIAEIRSQAQQYAQRLAAAGKRLDVICIDHLNLIRASDRYQGSKTAETEEVSMALKQLAKELQCAVICLCQLNRAVEGREEKRPNLSDLRWSGAIEQDADVVMFVYREAYYLERSKHDDMAKENDRLSRLERARNKLEVTFGKHRGGPCPVLEFYCDMGCGVVRDLDHGSN
jgi:replicative DNA helicase